MNGVPVTNQSQHEQQKGDQQQAGSFRGINRVAALLAVGIVLAVESLATPILYAAHKRHAMLHYASLVIVLDAMPAFPGNQSGRIARFGVFELDLVAGELRKNGAKLRLQEQPFQVLVLLLERGGDLVTREEMRQKLWPADTFVDFDHSLNTAVNKLRETLGDSASSPRYIETLARRGYRFIAPVQNVETAAPGSYSRARLGNSAGFSHRRCILNWRFRFPRRGLTRGLFALVQAMYLIFYVVALFRLHASAGHRRILPAGMARNCAGGRGDGDSRRWDSAALLPALRRGI